MKSKQISNGHIITLTCFQRVWGNQTLLFFYLMLNKSNERTKTVKLSLFVSDPSRSDGSLTNNSLKLIHPFQTEVSQLINTSALRLSYD